MGQCAVGCHIKPPSSWELTFEWMRIEHCGLQKLLMKQNHKTLKLLEYFFFFWLNIKDWDHSILYIILYRGKSHIYKSCGFTIPSKTANRPQKAFNTKMKTPCNRYTFSDPHADDKGFLLNNKLWNLISSFDRKTNHMTQSSLRHATLKHSYLKAIFNNSTHEKTSVDLYINLHYQ